MKALLLTDYTKLDVTDLPCPEVGPDDLLVRVAACGICGSDVHGYDGSTGRRIPPIVMGHEASGVVAEAGANVRRFRPGDRVTFDSTISCGTCYFCVGGHLNLCDRRRVLGVSCDEYRQHGAFAEYVAVPERIAYRIPDSLSFDHAALVEPVSIAFHAVGLTRVGLGDSALVVGAGMIGQLVVQTLRAAGCGRIIAVDLDETRLEQALKHGADHAVNAGSDDVPGQVFGLTGGRGVDLAFEAVGTAPAIQAAVASLRKGGVLGLIGNLTPRVEIPLQSIVTRELSLLGSCASSGEYPACLEMMARGRIDVSPFVSAVAPLEEGAGWFERLHRREPGLIKVVLQP